MKESPIVCHIRFLNEAKEFVLEMGGEVNSMPDVLDDREAYLLKFVLEMALESINRRLKAESDYSILNL